MNTCLRKNFSLNINGSLWELNRPRVMGILNLTPDSFYAGSRCGDADAVAARVRQMVEEGADMVDVGACSSRPGAEVASPEEEKRRLAAGLEIVRKLYPDLCVSVDTFRADIAEWAVGEYGVAVINDISGGEADARMFEVVARTGVPYVMMHMRGTPRTMMNDTDYEDVVADLLQWFACRIDRLACMGAKDIVVDPGFGFSKSLDDNYRLMCRLSEFAALEVPLLVGVSRKSMIYRLLGMSPEECLNGTTVLNTLALLGGADILRVHDVRAAVEAVKIVTKTRLSDGGGLSGDR